MYSNMEYYKYYSHQPIFPLTFLQSSGNNWGQPTIEYMLFWFHMCSRSFGLSILLAKFTSLFIFLNVTNILWVNSTDNLDTATVLQDFNILHKQIC